MSQWYVYLLECADGSLYCGSTVDPERRVQEHNGELPNGAKYTKVRRPVKLVYQEKCADRSAAGKREWEIKHLPRVTKEKLVKTARQ